MFLELKIESKNSVFTYRKGQFKHIHVMLNIFSLKWWSQWHWFRLLMYLNYVPTSSTQNKQTKNNSWPSRNASTKVCPTFTISSGIQKVFPSDLNGKESACNTGDPWIRKIPWRRARQLTAVFFPGESHGQRSLAGYSPWGHKESDMIDHAGIYC